MNPIVRILRIVLPIVFVAFVGLLIASYSGNFRSSRPADSAPVASTRPSDEPNLIAYEFEDTQTIGGRVVSRVRAERLNGFKSGWYTLERVELTVYRPNELTYVVLADQAQYHDKTKQAEIKGNVRVSSSDGVEVSTAQLEYDGARLVNRLPVQFVVDRWRGTAGGIDMAVDQELVRFVGDVTAELPPEADEPGVKITSREARFDRRNSEVGFVENVLLVRAADEMRTEWITARFERETRVLTGLEGGNNVAVTLPGGGSGLVASATETRLTGERFYTEVGPEGKLAAIHVVGEQTPAHARFVDVPEREVFARVMRVAMRGTVVTEIRSTGDVRIQELGELPRVITAQQATVYFDPAQRKARSALLEGGIRYRDGYNDVAAERGMFDVAMDKLVLTALPNATPTVAAGKHLIRAERFDITPRERLVRGIGQVMARLIYEERPGSGGATPIFSAGGQPIFINSDGLVMRQGQQAVFSGNVRAWQGENTLFSSELHVVGNGDALLARGGVRTTIQQAPQREGAPSRIGTKSDSLQAKRADGRIELEGNVVVDDTLRTLGADRAVFFIGADQKIERIETTANVRLEEKVTGRQGKADSMVYHLATRKVLMKGSPAEVGDTEGTIRGAEIAVDLGTNRIDVISGDKPTEATYKPKSGK
jgi:LPS export ABC transporter protein LptC/lipopolysaccharide transport protein LptA